MHPDGRQKLGRRGEQVAGTIRGDLRQVRQTTLTRLVGSVPLLFTVVCWSIMLPIKHRIQITVSMSEMRKGRSLNVMSTKEVVRSGSHAQITKPDSPSRSLERKV